MTEHGKPSDFPLSLRLISLFFKGLNFMVRQPHLTNYVRFNSCLDPVYRVAEKEWKDFIEKFTERLSEEVDDEIPVLPPKDVIHRLYRDVSYRPISNFSRLQGF